MGTVTVCIHALTEASVQVLLDAWDRLFGWAEPQLPNDLCLLRDDDAWLITMASDRVAILAVDDVEFQRVTATVPGLRLVPVDPGD